ncbi:hypothetical protein HDK77DRAFT_200460 [Phyllosticta capitalensis]
MDAYGQAGAMESAGRQGYTALVLFFSLSLEKSVCWCRTKLGTLLLATKTGAAPPGFRAQAMGSTRTHVSDAHYLHCTIAIFPRGLTMWPCQSPMNHPPGPNHDDCGFFVHTLCSPPWRENRLRKAKAWELQLGRTMSVGGAGAAANGQKRARKPQSSGKQALTSVGGVSTQQTTDRWSIPCALSGFVGMAVSPGSHRYFDPGPYATICICDSKAPDCQAVQGAAPTVGWRYAGHAPGLEGYNTARTVFTAFISCGRAGAAA